MLFCDNIFISGVRGSRKIFFDVPSCALDDGVDTPTDAFTASDCDRMTFFVRIADWPDPTKPQIGDTIRFDDKKFAVTRVARLADTYNLAARSTK